MDSFGWADVKPLLDESWFLEIDDCIRLERLITRHERFGKDFEAARTWAQGSDERNAEKAISTKFSADVIVTGNRPWDV